MQLNSAVALRMGRSSFPVGLYLATGKTPFKGDWSLVFVNPVG
jgi:hypothetical protein